MEYFYISKKILANFTKKELFDQHIIYCSLNKTVAVRMPVKNSKLKFENRQKQLPIPFVVYADFECFTKPINTCNPNPNDSFTYSYQKHEPLGFCLYLTGLDGIKKII